MHRTSLFCFQFASCCRCLAAIPAHTRTHRFLFFVFWISASCPRQHSREIFFYALTDTGLIIRKSDCTHAFRIFEDIPPLPRLHLPISSCLRSLFLSLFLCLVEPNNQNLKKRRIDIFFQFTSPAGWFSESFFYEFLSNASALRSTFVWRLLLYVNKCCFLRFFRSNLGRFYNCTENIQRIWCERAEREQSTRPVAGEKCTSAQDFWCIFVSQYVSMSVCHNVKKSSAASIFT